LLIDTYTQLAQPFTDNGALVQRHWQQLQKNYGSRKRHYHNLRHIEDLLAHIEWARPQINDYPATLFAVFYHDAVYNVLKQDNEQKSAELAIAHLSQMGVPLAIQQQCAKLILATRHHAESDDGDCDHFTDADLAILGSPPERYRAYAAAIRKEYAVYPDFLYNPGRKKVLAHFRAMGRIYKTGLFYDRFEAQARQNITWELGLY
jgi:predicted metal-dependent HD superfamily phosphohydrolase